MTATQQKPTEDFDDREGALPKWAQEKLALLRQQLADERKANTALRGDFTESDTVIRHYEIRPDHLLPPRSEISFVPDLARPHQEITCKMRDGQLQVHGERALIIRPRHNNGVSIELEN